VGSGVVADVVSDGTANVVSDGTANVVSDVVPDCACKGQPKPASAKTSTEQTIGDSGDRVKCFLFWRVLDRLPCYSIR